MCFETFKIEKKSKLYLLIHRKLREITSGYLYEAILLTKFSF